MICECTNVLNFKKRNVKMFLLSLSSEFQNLIENFQAFLKTWKICSQNFCWWREYLLLVSYINHQFIRKWFQPYLAPILLTGSQFPAKNISMNNFFCNAISKNIKKSKYFKSSKKSSGKRLKGLSKWMYLLFPHLISLQF